MSLGKSPIRLEATRLTVRRGYGCVTSDISNAVSDSASAPMIQIRWAATDLPDFVTHPLSPGVIPTENALLGEAPASTTSGNNLAARQDIAAQASGISGSTTRRNRGSTTVPGSRPSSTSVGYDQAPPFPTFSPPGSSGPGNNGLSTGAKAGIGVGVSVAALLMLGIVGFFWRKYRKNRIDEAAQNRTPPVDSSAHPWAQPQMTSQGDRYEMPSGDPIAMPQNAYLGREKAELSADSSHAGSQSFPSELHGQGYSGKLQQQHDHSQHGGWPEDSLEPHRQQSSELSAISPQLLHHHYSELSASSAGNKHLDEADRSPPFVQAPPPTYQDPSLAPEAASPSVSAPPGDTEVREQRGTQSTRSTDELRQQQVRLEERRQRLLELERIEREQEDLQQRIESQDRS